MTTLIQIQKGIVSLEEVITILEYAFHEADAEDRFENDYVLATKAEIGQIIIQPKDPFCYDPIAVNEALSNIFLPERYTLTVTCFMVMITKKIIR